MASDSPIWYLINLLRLKKAVRKCPHCEKVAYRTYWDAQAMADLTLAIHGESMRPYNHYDRRPRRWRWHLSTIRPRFEGQTYDHAHVVAARWPYPAQPCLDLAG